VAAVDLRDNRLCELCVELGTEKKARKENVQTYIGILDEVPHDSTSRDNDDSSDQGEQRSDLVVEFETVSDSVNLVRFAEFRLNT